MKPRKPTGALQGRIALGHVLGLEAFEAISAIDGKTLSEASRERLAAMKRRGLSFDEQRAEVIQVYRTAASTLKKSRTRR